MKLIRRISCALLFALLTPFASAAPVQEGEGESAPISEVMLLKLVDGSSLWGRIMSHDSERVSFQRLDNGGLVRMPWKQLEPAQSGELLEQFGYVDHSGDELTVEADRIELDDGTEVVGRIVSRTDNEIFVKTADRLVPVPKKRISGAVTSVVVPALDVYTREELYRAQADLLDPKSASSEYQLARYCDQIYDFTHSLEHYKAALAIDPDVAGKGGVLKQTILRTTEKAANQVQLDYLYQVDSMRAHGQFDAAMKALDVFEQKWPDSNLRTEAERKKKQIEKARLQTMREMVCAQWYKWVERLTTQQARLEGGTLEAALTFASEKLKEDVLAAVTKDMQRTVGPSVKPEEVKKLWEERKRGRFRHASYGQGTWLLGDAAALKEYGKEKPKTEEAPKTGAEKDRADLEAKIKRYMANQQVAGKKKAAAGKQDGEESDQEVYWRTWTSYARAQWLLAYYAENGGDLKIVREAMSNCPDCNGTGTRELINTGSARSNTKGTQPGQGANSAGLVMVDCPACHRIGRIRRVLFW
jgi:tetratricopeptide (TPR) repeat protein